MAVRIAILCWEVNFKTVVLIPAAFLGGLIAFGIQWSMYAANDRNWNDNSVTKAAVLVCMATPIVAFSMACVGNMRRPMSSSLY